MSLTYMRCGAKDFPIFFLKFEFIQVVLFFKYSILDEINWLKKNYDLL